MLFNIESQPYAAACAESLVDEITRHATTRSADIVRPFRRKRGFAWLIVVVCEVLISHFAYAESAEPSAGAVLKSAMDAMGGRDLLSSLSALRFDIRETQFRLDDSERNASPWWASNLKIAETRDLKAPRYRLETAVENPQFVYTQSTISDGKIIAIGITRHAKTRWQSKPEMNERMLLSPERVLFAAEQAIDLQKLPDHSIHDVMHHHLRFTWAGSQTDIYANINTHLPDRIGSLRTNLYDIAQNAWGDIRWNTDFLFWKREPDGLVYPRQWNRTRNDIPVFIDSLITLTENPVIEDGAFEIPEEAQRHFASEGHLPIDDLAFDGPRQISSIGKGVWLVSGNWNVMVVEQEDGLVVIECPQSGGYSAKLLAFLQQRFPKTRVKALVSTTDSTWHYAGLRTYIARGIATYALDLNVSLLRNFLAAPHTVAPDEYSRARHPADLRGIADRTEIGKGASRIELYPIRGEADERMMMVYFPELKLLYGSSNDVFESEQGEKAGTFNLPEVVLAAQARHLAVTSYVGIHTGATSWQDVVNAAMTGPAVH